MNRSINLCIQRLPLYLCYWLQFFWFLKKKVRENRVKSDYFSGIIEDFVFLRADKEVTVVSGSFLGLTKQWS
ncbi:unnamed protein product [Arabidopsis halleri]